jgi:hypothetical protein
MLLLTGFAAAAACGGSSQGPTGPSGLAGATIAGMVNRAAGSAAGLNVAVVGTDKSAAVNDAGYFQIGGVPSGTVQLRFRDASVDATTQLANVNQNQFIEIQVEVTASAATIVSENRSDGKVSLCHRTESGSYHLIDVSVNAESTHRAHGDGKIGEAVPGTQRQVFDESCRPAGPAVKIEKTTNGEEADEAPGPAIVVGSPVTWRYIVTNTGTIVLTGIAVTDDRGVAVSCGAQTSLGAGQSITCTGTGVATLGQYRNQGTVNAGSASGSVSDSDLSHYLGIPPPNEEEGPKVVLCHRTGNGRYHSIEVSINAEPAHRAHGDGKVGEPVPGSTGRVFAPDCSVR